MPMSPLLLLSRKGIGTIPTIKGPVYTVRS
jgi:hypothetical protein